jgi:hypothetical protein
MVFRLYLPDCQSGSITACAARLAGRSSRLAKLPLGLLATALPPLPQKEEGLGLELLYRAGLQHKFRKGIIEYLSSICVWLLQATGFSQSQPRLGHLHQQVFLLRAFRVLREAQTRPRIILVTLGFFDRHRGIPNPRLNSTLGH